MLHVHICVVLRYSKKLEKLPELEISEPSVLGVQIGKYGPLESVLLANQNQGFRIPQTAEKLERKYIQLPLISVNSYNLVSFSFCSTTITR